MKHIQIKCSSLLQPSDLPPNTISLVREDAERLGLVWKSSRPWAHTERVAVSLAERPSVLENLGQLHYLEAACQVELVDGKRFNAIATIDSKTMMVWHSEIFEGEHSAYMPVEDIESNGRAVYELTGFLNRTLEEIYPAKLTGSIPLLGLDFSTDMRSGKHRTS